MQDSGCWLLDSACWTLNPGCWTLHAGLWMLDPRCRTLDAGRWTLHTGLCTLDFARWTLDAGRWTLDSQLSTLDTVFDCCRTESEPSFWFCLIKLLKILWIRIFKDHGHACSVETTGCDVAIFRSSIITFYINCYVIKECGKKFLLWEIELHYKQLS